jgi:phage-related protein
MPLTRVVFYQSKEGVAEVLQWLEKLGNRDTKGVLKCLDRVELLKEFGHDLRRPTADFLRDGIYELRISSNRVQYRILYFFLEDFAILAHAIVKKGSRVPEADIDRAIERRRLFVADPVAYTYIEESDEEND